MFSVAEIILDNSRNVIGWTLLVVQEKDVSMWLDFLTIIRQYQALQTGRATKWPRKIIHASMCRQITTNEVFLTGMRTVNHISKRVAFRHLWKHLLALCDKTRSVAFTVPCAQVKASSCSTYPGKHSHRYEPGVLTHLWWQMLPPYIRHSSMSSTSTAFCPSCSSPMEKASLGYRLSDTTAHRESFWYVNNFF